LGPDLGAETANNPKRKALKKVLSLSLFLGQISDLVDEINELQLDVPIKDDQDDKDDHS
jgi:hypothetical protein